MDEPFGAHQGTSRRLGQRADVEDTTAVLLVLPGKAWRRKVRRIDVEVDNASLTGMGFFVRTPVDLSVRQSAQIELDGVRSNVRVRRRDVTDGGAYFGVEFVDSQPAIMPAIHALLDRQSQQQRTTQF